MIAGIVLNILNQIVFYRFKSNGSTYFYLLFMAIADMLCLIFAVPIGPCRCLPMTSRWHKDACAVYEVYLYLFMANIFASMSLLCTAVMSVDRYVHIRQSSKGTGGDLTHQRRRRNIVVSLVVTTSIAINIPYFFFKTVDDDGNAVNTEFSETLGFQIYTWVRMSCVKIVPIVTVGVANVLLIKIVVDMNRKRKNAVAPPAAAERRQQVQVTRKTL